MSAVTGVLLDGQWSTYLQATLEDYHAGRSSNVPTEMANQLKNIKTQFGDDVLLALAQYYASDKSTGGGGGGGGNGGGGDPKVVPLVPTGLTVTVVNNSQVNLGWKDNSNNETGFRVQRRAAGADDVSWITVAELGSNTVTYTDTSAAMGMTHDYRVTAFNTVRQRIQHRSQCHPANGIAVWASPVPAPRLCKLPRCGWQRRFHPHSANPVHHE